MKKLISILFLIFITLSVVNVYSQTDDDEGDSGNQAAATDKFGSDPDKCKMNLSLYGEFYKQKNFKDALPAWRWAFTNCPASSKNMYIHGINIVEYQMKLTKDEAAKDKYVDTLMIIYDQRIKYFGQEGFVLGRKGVDLFKYREKEIEKAHEMLKKSLASRGNKTEPAVLLTYMNTTVILFKSGKLQKADVVENYSKITEAIDTQIADKPENDNLIKAKENIEALFGNSGAPDCEALIGLFTPQYQKNNTDVKLLKNITRLLDKQGCGDAKLFFEASEKLYELEPSAEAAVNIAKMARKKSEFSKSSKYYLQAIDMQENTDLKAQYYLELAELNLKELNQFSSARTYALKALEFKPGWGKPYLVIGLAYASSSKTCGDNECAQKAVFWVAVDKFVKAKSVDPSVAEDANKLINAYSANYPNKEACFFYNITEGQSYTVGCWINETTTARF